MSELLTADEVAAALKVTKKTIYQLKYERKIPYIQVGGILRFRKEDIDKWLNDHAVSN